MKRSLLLAAATLAFAPPAGAWEFRSRFVERLGTTDLPLVGNTIDASSGALRRIRIQFGVFDDNSGPAPAGGLLGWYDGSLVVGGPVHNSDDRRNPGRLAPFNGYGDPYPNGNPPLPGGDPFTVLTEIIANLFPAVVPWHCAPDGTPTPMPLPISRALNEFVSVFEITTDPNPGAVSYTITVGGRLYAATGWRAADDSRPPECGDPADPADDIPGFAVYVPIYTEREFESVLIVTVPTPSTALFAALAAFALRRRRAAT